MGYTTEFSGSFDVSPTMDADMIDYINRFAETRRMQRDVEVLKDIFPNWKELCFNGDLGEEGGYFTTDTGNFGQDDDESVINHNVPPAGQPGLWCQWIASEDGNRIEWDQGEKFYHYVEWLEYLIDNFLAPSGYTLNGEVEWFGEDREDFGKIVVENNEVSELYGEIGYF